MELSINWKGKMAFSGVTPTGHEFIMDAAPEVGGENSGPRPTELLLQAVAGCTGIDIISILNKMRLEPSAFQMDVKGERAEEHRARPPDGGRPALRPAAGRFREAARQVGRDQ